MPVCNGRSRSIKGNSRPTKDSNGKLTKDNNASPNKSNSKWSKSNNTNRKSSNKNTNNSNKSWNKSSSKNVSGRRNLRSRTSHPNKNSRTKSTSRINWTGRTAAEKVGSGLVEERSRAGVVNQRHSRRHKAENDEEELHSICYRFFRPSCTSYYCPQPSLGSTDMRTPCSSAGVPVQQKNALVVPSGGDVDGLVTNVLVSDGWSIQHAVDNQHALALATIEPFDLI